MEYRVDLPQLENVEASNNHSHMDTGQYSNRLIGWMLLIFVLVEHLARMSHGLGFLVKYNHYFGTATLSILGLEVFILRVYRWRTDKYGITEKKFLRSRFIRWSEIREVKARKSQIGEGPDGYWLITNDLRLWIPVPLAMPREQALLIGSIWQHLRQYGRADAIIFPETLEDLYWNIPSSLPESVSWTNDYPPNWKSLHNLLIVKAVAWLLLMGVGIHYMGWHALRVVIVLGTMVMGAVWGFLYHWNVKDRTYAINASVDGDGLSAETSYGRVHLHWQDIRSADWDLSGNALYISGRKGRVRIPMHYGSMTLLLIILKHLRENENFQSIAIPIEIRENPQMRTICSESAALHSSH